MNRRGFNKLIALIGLLPFVRPAATADTQLEVGRMYKLIDKHTGSLVGIETCKRDGWKYFKDRIWAEDHNPQAFDRWRIEPTSLIDVSYNEQAENAATRQQWADERKRLNQWLEINLL